MIIIRSYKDVDFDQADENTLVIFDIDNTLLFDIAYKGTIQEEIFTDLEHRLPPKMFDLLCGIVYRKRAPILIEPDIIQILKKLKERNVATTVLTAKKTGVLPGLGIRFEDWRIQDLAKVGLIFNDPFKKTVIFEDLKYKPMLKAGIVFASDYDKGTILRRVFKECGCHFNRIMFFDDQEKNITSVAKAAEALGIAYQGYLYEGAQYAKKPKLDEKTEKLRFSRLEKDHVWLTPQELH